MIYLLLHNARTFFLCITINDAKKVATWEYQSEKLVTSLLTHELYDLVSVRVKMKVSSANGYLRAPKCSFDVLQIHFIFIIRK